MNANLGHHDKSTEYVMEPSEETPSKRMVTSDVSTATSSWKYLVKPQRSEILFIFNVISFYRLTSPVVSLCATEQATTQLRGKICCSITTLLTEMDEKEKC